MSAAQFPDVAARIRADLARQGIAVCDEDLPAIVKIVVANRAGLERARAAVTGATAPEVPQGFVPPAPPSAAPQAGR